MSCENDVVLNGSTNERMRRAGRRMNGRIDESTRMARTHQKHASSMKQPVIAMCDRVKGEWTAPITQCHTQEDDGKGGGHLYSMMGV